MSTTAPGYGWSRACAGSHDRVVCIPTLSHARALFLDKVYKMVFEGQEPWGEDEQGSAAAPVTAPGAASGAMGGTEGLVLVKQVLLHPGAGRSGA